MTTKESSRIKLVKIATISTYNFLRILPRKLPLGLVLGDFTLLVTRARAMGNLILSCSGGNLSF